MKYKRISELTTVVTGGTPSTSVAEYWDNGTIPWLQSGCCQNCNVDSTEKFITQAGYDNSSTRIMPKDTVMIALTGATAGKIGYLTFEACGNQSITGILPCESLNQRFLFYYLISQRPQILADCVGGAQAHISQGYVKNIEIPLYSLEKQKQIVGVIDKVASVLTARELELEKLDELIKARFVEMFGDPVDNPKGYYVATLQELIDKGYITYHLDGNHGGDYPRSEEFVDSGVPYISANCIVNGEIDFSKAKYLTPERAGKLRKGIAQDEDVLFAHNATVGPTVVLHTDEDKVILGTSLTAYRCNKAEVMPNYLKAYMLSDGFVRQYSGEMKQTTRNQVPITAQKKYLFLIPPIEEQEQFATFVKQLDKSKAVVQKALDEAQLLFDSLMQHYFG